MTRKIILLTAILLASRALLVWASSLYILVYHSFMGNGSGSMDFSESEFRDHLERFKKLGYTWVSLGDAIAGSIQGRKNLVMTIDDGHRSVADVWDRVIRPAGIVPNLFVSAALIKYDKLYLKPDRLRNLYDQGCLVGAHGFSHYYLTKNAFDAEQARSLAEINKPGSLIADWLGKPPAWFAYPFGVHSEEAKKALAAAGYRYGFLAAADLVSVDFSDPSMDPYSVPRTIVYRWNIESIFKKLETR